MPRRLFRPNARRESTPERSLSARLPTAAIAITNAMIATPIRYFVSRIVMSKLKASPVKLQGQSLPPICTLRSLWRAATIVSLPKKSILNLSVDTMEPLLCALGSLPVRHHFGLKLGNPIFGRPKLVRKPLRRIDCMSAVLLSDIRSFIQELKDRLTGFVDFSVVVGRALSRSRKWNRFGTHY